MRKPLWFRMYTSILDPEDKSQNLTDRQFRHWILLIAAFKRNEGVMPDLRAMARCLRVNDKQIEPILKSLSDAGLLERSEGGWQPHDWNDHQYDSDVSTDRVREFRKRNGNVSRNKDETFQRNTPLSPPPTTPPLHPSTESREQTTDHARARRNVTAGATALAISPISARFDDWWGVWAKYRGSNHRQQASQAWLSVATKLVEAHIFACTASYIQSRSPGDGGYNPETFLFDQSQDGFKARWPARSTASAAERNQQLMRDEFAERMARHVNRSA